MRGSWGDIRGLCRWLAIHLRQLRNEFISPTFGEFSGSKNCFLCFVISHSILLLFSFVFFFTSSSCHEVASHILMPVHLIPQVSRLTSSWNLPFHVIHSCLVLKILEIEPMIVCLLHCNWDSIPINYITERSTVYHADGLQRRIAGDEWMNECMKKNVVSSSSSKHVR